MKDKVVKADKTLEENPAQGVTPELEFKAISLDLIDDPAAPMRNEISDASLEDLVLSIKQVGIIEPLVVKMVKGRYEVIAGHRRLLASKLARIGQVPCYVRKASLEQTEMLKIHENLYRAEISPAEESRHFSYLIDKQKMTPTQIANITGKSASYVSDRLAILEYPDFLKEAMDKKEITFSVAREFARFNDEKQMRTAVYYAKRGGMTQDMARRWVQDHKRSQENPGLQPVVTGFDANGAQEIEHLASCVKCGGSVRLIEAEVVYMHHECLKEAQMILATESPDEIQSAAETQI